MDRPARVDESDPIAGQPLKNKSFAAKQSGEDFFLECNSNLHAPSGAKKRIFLANELLAEFIEVHGDDFSGVGGGERHFLSFVPHGPECGEKERFPGDHSFAGVEKLAEESLVLAGIAKDGLHFDSVGHVHHGPRLGDHHLVRIECDFDKLHVVAEQLVVDLVCAACGRRSRRLDGLLRPDA